MKDVPDQTGSAAMCENCGYLLRGLSVDSACPECGFTADRAGAYAARRRRARHVVLAVMYGVLSVLMVTVTVSLDRPGGPSRFALHTGSSAFWWDLLELATWLHIPVGCVLLYRVVMHDRLKVLPIAVGVCLLAPYVIIFLMQGR